LQFTHSAATNFHPHATAHGNTCAAHGHTAANQHLDARADEYVGADEHACTHGDTTSDEYTHTYGHTAADEHSQTRADEGRHA
jgi:hypothetical protein